MSNSQARIGKISKYKKNIHEIFYVLNNHDDCTENQLQNIMHDQFLSMNWKNI